MMPTKDGVEFSALVSGAEDQENTCKVVTGRVGSAIGQINGPIYLHYELLSQSGNFGLWHLYPPDTPLSNLPLK